MDLPHFDELYDTAAYRDKAGEELFFGVTAKAQQPDSWLFWLTHGRRQYGNVSAVCAGLASCSLVLTSAVKPGEHAEESQGPKNSRHLWACSGLMRFRDLSASPF